MKKEDIPHSTAYQHMLNEIELQNQITDQKPKESKHKVYEYKGQGQTDQQQNLLNFDHLQRIHTQERSSQSSIKPKKIDNSYILLAVVASLFNATGHVCRGIESNNVMASSFLFATTWLIVPIVYLIYRKLKARNQGHIFYMPWYEKIQGGYRETLQDEERVKFQYRILLVLIGGGVFEFVGGWIFNVSFNFGEQANLNDGIPSALLLFSSVIILVLAYIIYRDKINFLQGVGLAIILIGVIIITFFKAEPMEVVDGQLVYSEHQGLFKFLSIFTGLLAATCFAGEVILVRQMDKYNMEGDIGGYFYSLFVGIQGAICLIIYAASTRFENDKYQTYDYFILLFGGVMETLGMVLQIMAASRGIGGIAFGIANTCSIYVTLFNYFVRSQPITMEQVIGIVGVILGASVIAVEEQIYNAIFRRKNNTKK